MHTDDSMASHVRCQVLKEKRCSNAELLASLSIASVRAALKLRDCGKMMATQLLTKSGHTKPYGYLEGDQAHQMCSFQCPFQEKFGTSGKVLLDVQPCESLWASTLRQKKGVIFQLIPSRDVTEFPCRRKF